MKRNKLYWIRLLKRSEYLLDRLMTEADLGFDPWNPNMSHLPAPVLCSYKKRHDGKMKSRFKKLRRIQALRHKIKVCRERIKACTTTIWDFL